jgi:hypothetical protein
MGVIIFRKYDWNIEKFADNTNSDDGFEVSLSEGDELSMSVLELLESSLSWLVFKVIFVW